MTDNITQLFDPVESAYIEMTDLMNQLYEKYNLDPYQFCYILRRYDATLNYDLFAESDEGEYDD